MKYPKLNNYIFKMIIDLSTDKRQDEKIKINFLTYLMFFFLTYSET